MSFHGKHSLCFPEKHICALQKKKITPEPRENKAKTKEPKKTTTRGSAKHATTARGWAHHLMHLNTKKVTLPGALKG